MSQTVVGIFEKVTNAEKAMDRLLNEGFTRDRVDIADHTSRTDHSDDDDSIGGFFSSLFGDSDDTRHHADAAKSGVVVTVHAQSKEEAERAADILDDHGTVNVNERANMNRDTTATAAATTETTTNSDQTIDVVEEELQVGKREVQTGGVRVRSRIVERPVEETVRLRTEHVNAERNPVDRPVTEADMSQLKDTEIEITESAESAVASKEARVVEEIHIDKNVEEHEEVIQDTVRSTEVDVEEVAGEGRELVSDEERLAKEQRMRDNDGDLHDDRRA